MAQISWNFDRIATPGPNAREDKGLRSEQPNRGALRTGVEASLQSSKQLPKAKLRAKTVSKSISMKLEALTHHQDSSHLPSSGTITEIRHTGFVIGAPDQ